MQRRTLLAACSVVVILLASAGALVFAGTAPSPLLVPSVESGAAPLRSTADARAAAWQSDAYLTRVYATEGRPVDGRVDPPVVYDTSPDPVVGNGMAVVWSFVYVSPSSPGEMFIASVGGDGLLLYARPLRDPSQCCVAYAEASPATSDAGTTDHGDRLHARALHPKVDFDVDAPQAFAAVRERPEFREFALDHPVHQAVLELTSMGDGRSAWNVGLVTATWFSARATVDADTGEVLHVSSWPPIGIVHPDPPCCWEPWVPEDHHSEHEGTLSSTNPWFNVEIPVASRAHAERLAVKVTLDGGLPTDAYVLRVMDGQWREVGRDDGTGTLSVEVTEFATEGPHWARLEARPPFLTEAAVRMIVDVAYRDEAAPVPDALRSTGEVQAFWGQWWFPLGWEHADAGAAVATLVWERPLPTDNLELVHIDAFGNEVRRVRGEAVEAGASTLTLEFDATGRCCGSLAVRGVGASLVPVAFELTVEFPALRERGHHR